MKKIKIVIDSIFVIAMILLMNTNITGMNLHEIVGTAILGIILIHLILNFKWIKAISKNLFSKNINTKSKFIFIFDMITLITGIITVIFGIGISTTIFTNIEFKNIELFTFLHKLIAQIFLICMSIHLGIHIAGGITKFKKKNNFEDSKFTFTEKLVTLIFIILGTISYLKDENLKDILSFLTSKDNKKLSAKNYATSNTTSDTITIYTNNEDEKYELIASTTATSGASDELSKKLSSTTCTGCGRRCLLSSPRCQRGVQQANVIKAEYSTTNTSLNQSTSNTSSSNSNSTSTINSSSQVNIQNDTTENLSTDLNTNTSTTNNNLENDNQSKASYVLGNIGEMGFWIAGTYYTVKKKQRKS